MQQAQINEAGHRAEAEARGMAAERGDEKNQQMQQKVRRSLSAAAHCPMLQPACNASFLADRVQPLGKDNPTKLSVLITFRTVCALMKHRPRTACICCCVAVLLQALDPSSVVSEAPVDSPQQMQQLADNAGPAGAQGGMQVCANVT
jgi:hypothetical protein